MLLIEPKILPPLNTRFRPAVLANRHFRQEALPLGCCVVMALERENGDLSRYETPIFPEGHSRSNENIDYLVHILKFLLWQRGGFKVLFEGPISVFESLKSSFSPTGENKFNHHVLSRKVYEKDLEFLYCPAGSIPVCEERGKQLGRNLNGCRIGFDLGASDRKVSAVIDGNPVYSEEVVWEPGKQSNPEYHYHEIMAALHSAASKMPRLDAIGGSSAGIYINNHPMVASLFRGISTERFPEIKNVFLRIRSEMDVPLEVINDGDVTALAGSMSLGENAVLGIALGSSEATGYVNPEGHIMGWLNELSFASIDYDPEAVIEDWSGGRGCGASYLSQQCVFHLAPLAGIEIPSGITDAEKLKFVQSKLESGEEGARHIWQSMGIFLGYAIAHYADFYDFKHILILGRCTSGCGGTLLLEGAKDVLTAEFPELLQKIEIHLPDEKIRRVGQSVAAASLPVC